MIAAAIEQRQALQDLLVKTRIPRRVRAKELEATYDAARDGDEFKNYWANSDRHDADSSNSVAVRKKLVPRNRYEVANNGYAAGIANTFANDLVGIGPSLRMQTGSPGFNQLVEREWGKWCKATNFRRKLWCQAHAKIVDGEGVGVVRTNPGVSHPVKLDVVLYETEQISTPMLPVNAFGFIDGLTDQGGYIDGIAFDRYGNPLWYDVLHRHPGSQNWVGSFAGFNLIPEKVPAKFMLFWAMMTRPGQHRGIPECVSTMNVGASSRRWREATVAAAETAADYSVILETEMPPNGDADMVGAFTDVEIQKRMMVANPMGWKSKQLAAEHPNATYEAFHKAQINEQARPKSMPYNKAACDSSSYNYASGRLDHQTYYGALDVEREDGNDLVLDPLFELWFIEAVMVFGWLGGNPAALSPAAIAHSWDWPKHQVADIQAESSANDINLKNGSLSLTKLYAKNGEDFDDELPVMANDYFGTDEESGMTQDERNKEMRKLLRTAIFNDKNQIASMKQADNQAANSAASGDKTQSQGAPANAA